ncbi:MAG: NAD(P)-dependent oxidoreductase [Bacteroidetes bacterium]|nr:NAD(P)-dependent oxidoreductase [Bacteroidota bacterium]
MKILITGSNGLLGQKIVYALLKLNAGQKPVGNCIWPEVSDMTIIATSKGENRIIEKSGYIFESLDISDKKQVETILNKHRPDVVINTAAMTNVDACETQKEECWKANVIAVQNLVDVLSAYNLKPGTWNPQLIHLSTDFIFDGEAGPYKEDDKPNPLSYYALSKYESEKVIQASKIKWAILRTIIVYGIVDNMSRTNIVLWAKGALAKGEKINVVDDQFRAPTLAEDLAQGCILTALKGATGIYNVSGKDIMSILELVYAVADFWKLDKSIVNPIKSDTLNQAAKRPPRTGFILDKAIKELGYTPHSFKEGLAILDEQLKK